MWNIDTIVQRMHFERRKGLEVKLRGNLFLEVSVRVNTVHFDDRGTLGQVGRHNHLADYVNSVLKKDVVTYRDSHQLLDVLDLVTR